MKICRVTTVPFFLLHHLRGQVEASVAAGHVVWAVCCADDGTGDAATFPGIRFRPIEIARRIAPLADLRAVWQLYRFFRSQRFDIVHSATPKAGLLTAIAGWLARVPVRMHSFTGQAWAELSGPVRWIAQFADRVIVTLNTRCYADSPSQRRFMIESGVTGGDGVAVLGDGSLGGVDFTQFDPQRVLPLARARRAELGIPDGDPVIAFIGRVNRDKGIVELVNAYRTLLARIPHLHLVLVGYFEPHLDPLPEDVLATIRGSPGIHAIGYHPQPETFVGFADLLCLPSYREGFGNVVIEAAALEIPTVGTRIVGLVDAVADGDTGILVAPKDAAALAVALERLLADGDARKAMGRRARERALRLFDSARINRLLLEQYQRESARSARAA